VRDFHRLLVPYDFSDHARAALGLARDLASRLGADLHLVHVINVLPYYSYPGYAGAAPVAVPDLIELRDSVAKSLAEVAAEVSDPAGKVETHVVDGPVADAICKCAEEIGAGLIVMGTHGRTGLAHVFLGSVAERTLRKAPCAVVTTRADEGEES
jgi:nucleotide-binding universal stress UspA family protein